MQNSSNIKNKYDVCVIGGGPSGMMTAITASKRGRKVIILEKNSHLGKKLLITGGGRCNITNAEYDIHTLLSKYKEAKNFLFSPFSKWGPKSTINFFHTHNLQTKIEPEKRVFPITDSARSVWQVLLDELYVNKVDIRYNSSVKSLNPKKNLEDNSKKIQSVTLEDGVEIFADSFVVATGSKSRPETGSTGDAYLWLQKLGHKIMDSDPTLVPLSSPDKFLKSLQGMVLNNIKISLFLDDKKIDEVKGKVLFTHFGLSGPTILNFSKKVGEALKRGRVYLLLDLFPQLTIQNFNSYILPIIQKNNNKSIKNTLEEFIDRKLIPILLECTYLNSDIKTHSFTKESRLSMLNFLKNFRVNIDSLLGSDKAIVTSGGVSLTEINMQKMSSILYPNLFIVGDMLHIDRPSGGFSLEICWTTGFVAGSNA